MDTPQIALPLRLSEGTQLLLHHYGPTTSLRSSPAGTSKALLQVPLAPGCVAM